MAISVAVTASSHVGTDDTSRHRVHLRGCLSCTHRSYHEIILADAVRDSGPVVPIGKSAASYLCMMAEHA